MSPAESTRTTVIEATEAFIKEYMAQYKDSSHDWLHVNRVRNIAVKLASMDPEQTFDLEIVQLAALLHDVGDIKHNTDGEAVPRVIASLLAGQGYPADKIDRVIEIVDHVSYRHELEYGCSPDKIKAWNEFTVVQDADRLDAIGAVGVARCFAYNGRKNLPFYIPGEKPIFDMSADDYNAQTKKNGGSARFHFDEKLLKLKELMKSKGGKAEAERRHAFMLSFLEHFDQDCGLELY